MSDGARTVATGAAACTAAASPNLPAVQQEYLAALLQWDRAQALNLIRSTHASGVGVRDLYLSVLAPAQRAVGEGWQAGRISVAQEHFCTAATQVVMGELFQHVPPARPGARRMLVACSPGELHEIGARMVADLFELEGWDADYLGAPSRGALVAAVLATRAQLVGLSVTMPEHWTGAMELAAAVRAHPACAAVKIIVGGPGVPSEWADAPGPCDGCANDFDAALALAARLVPRDPLP